MLLWKFRTIILEMVDTNDISIPRSRCEECRERLCCVVFDIINESEQWRNLTTMKPGWQRCVHLQSDNFCEIYHERKQKNYISCERFDCHGAGNILSEWTQKHQIPVAVYSTIISHFLENFTNFLNVHHKKEYEERVRFLEGFLVSHNTLESAWEEYREWKSLEKAFQKNRKS